MLDTLPRRGPQAYDRFVRALVLTHQDDIADFLDANASARHKAERAERAAAFARLTQSMPARIPTYAEPPVPQPIHNIVVAQPPVDPPMTEIPREMGKLRPSTLHDL